MKSRVLVVDGSRAMGRILKRKLNALGIETIEAASSNQALAKLNRYQITLITTALLLPDEDGLSFIRAVRQSQLHSHTPVFVVSSDKRVGSDLDPRGDLGISEVIDKSQGLDFLIDRIVASCAQHELPEELIAG